MLTMTTQIPVIDFAPFLEGNATEKQAVVEQIYVSCHEVGFMYLRNIGIPRLLIVDLLDQSKQFFNLPSEVKEQLARSSETNCGYVGLQKERLNPKNPWDLKEVFNMGIQSVWLPHQEAFRDVVTEFYRLCTTEVAPDILRAFAIALHQPEAFFADKHSRHYFLRMLHYPPVDQIPQPGQLRAGEHTDYGSITLLLQDRVGGLEVQTRQGDWIAAPPIEDTIVVNVGDAMQRWTNDRLSSTPHRVAVPLGVESQRSRYSIALFCDPDPDVEIACSDSSDRVPQYPPILAGEYLASRLAATY